MDDQEKEKELEAERRAKERHRIGYLDDTPNDPLIDY